MREQGNTLSMYPASFLVSSQRESMLPDVVNIPPMPQKPPKDESW